ncbi:MAG: hypothetical protein IJE77_08145, partial [Thermoguttaceae bacterium]|nr:hypothetical protein [Thermoguttaceae bacterium]
MTTNNETKKCASANAPTEIGDLAKRRATGRLRLARAPKRTALRWRRNFRLLSERFDALLEEARQAAAQRRLNDAVEMLTALEKRVGGL